MFPVSEIGVHAALCDIDKSPEPPNKMAVLTEQKPERSFQEKLTNIKKKLDDVWEISVVRNKFIQTVMREVEGAQEKDWSRGIRVEFIGEEGIDSGGFGREFFSLLFRTSPVFEKGSFSMEANLLKKKHYFFLGRMTAMAIIHGHPGPKRLNQYLVDYILGGQEPSNECLSENLSELREDIAKWLRDIGSVSDDKTYDVVEKYAEVLDGIGFKKTLNPQTKDEATRAIIKHYLFFRYLPPILQFIDGLKLHGVYEVLTHHMENGRKFLMKCPLPTYLEVKSFFQPVFSVNHVLKEKEQMVMFNFGQFLKNVERDRVKTDLINLLENGKENEVKGLTVTLKMVLQALLGSEYLPTDIESGIIEFDHEKDTLSSVNTCAPSVTFRQLDKIQSYDCLEQHLINIVLRTDGFGIE